jgi:hypothetical protein
MHTYTIIVTTLPNTEAISLRDEDEIEGRLCVRRGTAHTMH